MKIQDIVFFIVFLILLMVRKDRWFLYTGLACLVLAIPLFAKWIFFTAERLTWYGSFFVLCFIISSTIKISTKAKL